MPAHSSLHTAHTLITYQGPAPAGGGRAGVGAAGGAARDAAGMNWMSAGSFGDLTGKTAPGKALPPPPPVEGSATGAALERELNPYKRAGVSTKYVTHPPSPSLPAGSARHPRVTCQPSHTTYGTCVSSYSLLVCYLIRERTSSSCTHLLPYVTPATALCHTRHYSTPLPLHSEWTRDNAMAAAGGALPAGAAPRRGGIYLYLSIYISISISISIGGGGGGGSAP
jgi:hypothetical protein